MEHDTAGALDALSRAVAIARQAGDVARLARSALETARLGMHTGLDAQHPASALLLEALDAVPTAPTALRSEVLAALALAEGHSRPLDVARGHAEEALSIARLLAQPDVMFCGARGRGCDRPRLGEPAACAGMTRWWFSPRLSIVRLGGAERSHSRLGWPPRPVTSVAGALLDELGELALVAGDAAGIHLADLRFLLERPRGGDVHDANDAISRGADRPMPR
jgi:hypothetical protein